MAPEAAGERRTGDGLAGAIGETIRGLAHFTFFVGTVSHPSIQRVLWIQSFDPHPTTHFSIDQDTGRIGFGTGTPTAALDIAPRDGIADLRLASAGESWRFTNRGEVMTLSRDGSGGEELEIRGRLDAAGPTMVVQGSVQGTQVVNSSSRKLKTGFEDLDASTVLAKLAELPVSTWRYRHEPEGSHHVGPVAEDFQALFGLGDGETISTVDALGVLMAGLQALHAETRVLRERIEELEGRAPTTAPTAGGAGGATARAAADR